MKTDSIVIPGIGPLPNNHGMISLETCGDGYTRTGVNGVDSITATGDGKVEFIAYADRTIAHINSAMGYPASYPLHEARIDPPVRAVLMDLDGTSVHSEAFWIWIIEQATASLLDNPSFELEDADLPYVSGHSVGEHLQHCIDKYCPDADLEAARAFYFEHTRREMKAILDGGGRRDAFTPAPGLKEFLLELKSRDIRVGLVTSGLYEKAWPEILSAFRELDMGDPAEFYDSIITAGHQPRGSAGTLGELEAKPHPWLYAEVARVGLGIPFSERHHVVGIEDSGAGVCSIRLAGFAALGLEGGNIHESGTAALCTDVVDNFEAIIAHISCLNP